MNLNPIASSPFDRRVATSALSRDRNEDPDFAGIVDGASRTAQSEGSEKEAAAAQARNPLSDKTVFLQLLVSQIKYQNPLEPADSIQYVTQLNQFSATEQLVEIRKLLEPKTANGGDNTTGGRA